MTSRLALDTNAYRALDDGNTVLADYVRSAASVGLPLIVLGELYYGIYLGSRHAENLRNLQAFLASPRLEVLQPNETTARLFGEIAVSLRKAGRPIQQDDMWIAALCKQYDYTLASADKGFSAIIGLETIEF